MSGSELVIISGYSGSGKTTVLRTLEDIGYYTVDNLPVDLLPSFAHLISTSGSAIGRAAMVMDIRGGESVGSYPRVIKGLKDSGHVIHVVFLEASLDPCVDLHRDEAEILLHQPPHLKFYSPLRGYFNTLECFGILGDSCCSCARFKNTEVTELQAVIITQLGNDFIEESLYYSLDQNPLCLCPLRNSTDKFFLRNCCHRLPRFKKD